MSDNDYFKEKRDNHYREQCKILEKYEAHLENLKHSIHEHRRIVIEENACLAYSNWLHCIVSAYEKQIEVLRAKIMAYELAKSFFK